MCDHCSVLHEVLDLTHSPYSYGTMT